MAILSRTTAAAASLALALAIALTGCAAPQPSPEATTGDKHPGAAVPVPEVDVPEAPQPAPEPAPEAPAAPDPEPAATMPPEQQPEPLPAPEPVDTTAPEAAPKPAATAAPKPPPARFTLAGRVILTGRDADAAETVLYFEPDGPTEQPEAGQFDIATRDKTFEPAVMVVPRGSVVRFPNRDPILHNVFSVSAGNAFDLGVYGPDAAPEARLNQTGTVNVYCNVHHEMHAHVLVLDTPWFTQADAEGTFALTELPPGPGTLHAWHRQAEVWSARIEGPATASIEVRLNVVRRQLPAHTDKTGQSYFRKDRDPYR